MLGALVTAIRTLTVFSVSGKETGTFSNALFWFPCIGFFLGLLEAAFGYSAHFFDWNELSAAIVVLGGIAVTRGLHVDGLADMADGFWGGRTKEARLRIMKDPNVGSFGAVALSGILLLKWIAVVKLVESGSFEVIVAGVLLARWVQVLLASLLPYARSEGGTASSFVKGAGRIHIVVTSIMTLFFLLLLFHTGYYPLAAIIPAALVSGVAIGALSYKKIGGVTGDVLGAGSEVTETVVWIVGALFSGSSYMVFST